MSTSEGLVTRDLVIGELAATDKPGVIRELAGLLASAGRIGDARELVRVLFEREALGSTGIGDGVAIPHGKLRMLNDVVVAFGRSSRGVDFDSLDAKPAHLFFMLVSPEDRPAEHLKTLARISRMLKNPSFRDSLMQVSRTEDLQRLINEEDGKYPLPQARSS